MSTCESWLYYTDSSPSSLKVIRLHWYFTLCSLPRSWLVTGVPICRSQNLNVSLIIQSVTQSVIPRMRYLTFTLSYQDFAFALSLSRISSTCPVIASRPTSLSSHNEICVVLYGSVVKLFRLRFYRPRDLLPHHTPVRFLKSFGTRKTFWRRLLWVKHSARPSTARQVVRVKQLYLPRPHASNSSPRSPHLVMLGAKVNWYILSVWRGSVNNRKLFDSKLLKK